MGKVHRLSSVVEEYREKWLFSLEMVDISFAEASIALGANTQRQVKTFRGNICSVCKGNLKSYKGYKWQYYEDIVDSL